MMFNAHLESDIRQPLLGPHKNAGRREGDLFFRDVSQSLDDLQQQSAERDEINAIEMRFGLTPVRRMFCLLALFDFLLVFLLWIIYVQVLWSQMACYFSNLTVCWHNS